MPDRFIDVADGEILSASTADRPTIVNLVLPLSISYIAQIAIDGDRIRRWYCLDIPPCVGAIEVFPVGRAVGVLTRPILVVRHIRTVTVTAYGFRGYVTTTARNRTQKVVCCSLR